MCGSRPEPELVTRSIGTAAVGFSFRAAATFAATASISFLFVGPRFDPLELAASYPAPAADGRPWKYAGDEKGWPMSRDPIGRPSRTMICPLAFSGNHAWASAVIASG